MGRLLASEQAHNVSLLSQVCREISEAFLSLDFMFLWALTRMEVGGLSEK